jgi:hypothetical protein
MCPEFAAFARLGWCGCKTEDMRWLWLQRLRSGTAAKLPYYCSYALRLPFALLTCSAGFACCYVCCCVQAVPQEIADVGAFLKKVLPPQ